MSDPPAAADSETSTDDDFISEHFVTELISQRFDLFNQHNNAMLLESEGTEEDLLDNRLMKSFEELLRDSSSLTENSIPIQSLMLMGPRPLVSDDMPTCSHFGELNENFNINDTIQLKNNQFSSHEEPDFERSYPLELIKNNRKDKKMLKLFVSERFQSNDLKSKKIKQKVEAIINEHHDALINMVNNDLDICRMNLEQKMRKAKRLFQSFIKKLIDENYHIAYSEIEFTTMIDKKLLDEFEKLKNRVNKHLHQEKYSVRDAFFKSVKANRTEIEKHFNFVDFLFLFTTLLENKIEIVNNCVRNDMDQLIGEQRKEVRNFISNRILLPNHERLTPFGNFLGTSRATTGIYNETIFINNNFHDTRELLFNFESLSSIKAAERNLKSASKQNKQLGRIFDELAATTGGVGSENSDQEQDPDLKFLIHQIALLNESENSAVTEPLTTAKTVSKVKPKRASGKNSISYKNGGNAQQFDGLKKTYKKGLDELGTSLQAQMQSERKIIRARRIKKAKANTVDNIEALQVEPIIFPEMTKFPNISNESTPNVQLTSKSNENALSLAVNNSSSVSLGCTPNIKHEHSFPDETSLSVSQPDNKTHKIQLLKENQDVNNDLIHSFTIETRELKQDINNQTTEPVPALYNSGTELKENERNVVISQPDNEPHEIQLLTENQDVNNDLIQSFTIDTRELKQDINNQTTEPVPALYNSGTELQEHERNVVNDIMKDEAIKDIVMQDIGKKLTEIENSVADMYQKLVVANIEYQKLMRYKEEINRSQLSDTINKPDNNGKDYVEENI